MAYWLLKTEPGTWSWEEQTARGARGEPWSGVRNAAARLHMKVMKKGDLAFFFHTGKEKRVVGIVKVVRAAYPDPEDESWPLVNVAAVEPLASPVTLARVRAEPRLAEMVLVKNSRLSVQPVTGDEWKLVRKIGGMK